MIDHPKRALFQGIFIFWLFIYRLIMCKNIPVFFTGLLLVCDCFLAACLYLLCSKTYQYRVLLSRKIRFTKNLHTATVTRYLLSGLYQTSNPFCVVCHITWTFIVMLPALLATSAWRTAGKNCPSISILLPAKSN